MHYGNFYSNLALLVHFGQFSESAVANLYETIVFCLAEVVFIYKLLYIALESYIYRLFIA